jgi:hypothetical protein
MAILQVWSAPPGQPGATALGPLTGWSGAVVRERAGEPPNLTLSLPLPIAQQAGIGEGYVLRVLSSVRGESWWLITAVTDADGAGDLTVGVRCGSLLELLAVRGIVRDGNETSFDSFTDFATMALSRYVLPNRAEDQLEWLSEITSFGVVTVAAFPAFSRQTRLWVVREVERLTGATARIVPILPGPTGFRLEMVSDLGATVAPTRLSVGSSMRALERTRELMQGPSVALLVPSSGAPQPTAWRVHEVIGAGPYWVRLGDPLANDPPFFYEPPGPIREDGQFVGAYLQTRGGDTHEILASRASDHAVQVAAITGINPTIDPVAWHRETVYLVTNTTTGAPLREIASPRLVSGSRGRVVRDIGLAVTSPALNLVRDPIVQSGFGNAGPFPDLNAPPAWPAVGTCPVVIVNSIDSPTWTAIVNGNQSIGATTLNVRDADGVIYPTEGITLPSGNIVRVAGTVPVGPFGTLAIPLTAGLPVNLTDGQTVNLTGTNFNAVPARPTAADLLVLEAEQGRYDFNWMRLIGDASSGAVPPTVGVSQRRNEGVRIKYDATRPTVYAAARFAIRNGHPSADFGNWNAGSVPTADPALVVTRRHPGIMLVGDPAGTPTRLAWNMVTEIIPGGAYRTPIVTTNATLSADTTVSLAVLNGVSSQHYMAMRWAAMWIGASGEPPVPDPVPSSGTNPVFHAAQNALQQGTRYRLTGVDLAALIGSGQPLVLGQRIIAHSETLGIDEQVQILGLEWQLAAEAEVSIDAGVLLPRLTAATVVR